MHKLYNHTRFKDVVESVVEVAPFYAPLLYNLNIRLKPGSGTIAITQRLTVYLDEAWFNTLPLGEAMGVLVHELHHIIHKHHQRGIGFEDKELANIAADLTINPALIIHNWQLPVDCIFPKHYGLKENESFEYYYKQLLKQRKEGKSTYPQNTGAAKGKCGSCAGGVKDEHEDEHENQQAQGTEDAEGTEGESSEETPSPGDVAELVAETRALAKDCVEKGQCAGRTGVFTLLEGKSLSTIDYRKLLRRIVLRHMNVRIDGDNDYSKKRPSKKSLMYGRSVSSLISYEPQVTIVLDVSGSMDVKKLMAGTLEILKIVKAADVQFINLVTSNTSVVEKYKRLSIPRFKHLKLETGGGTDFNEALAAVDKNDIKTDVCLFITDGDGENRYIPKTYELIWVLVGPNRRAEKMLAPSGDIVVM